MFCASFRSHQSIQTGVTVRKRPIRAKIGDVLSGVTLKFYGRPWKTIGHLFYATSRFVHHFEAISQPKRELQSTHSMLLQALYIISQPSVNSNPSYSTETGYILSCVTLKFAGWPRKTIGHLFCAASKFMHHFVVICKFNLELRSGNGQIGAKFCFDLYNLDLCPLTLTFCIDISLVYGNDFWEFMMIRWKEHNEKCVTEKQTDGRTDIFQYEQTHNIDGRTDRSVLRAVWSQLKHDKHHSMFHLYKQI